MMKIERERNRGKEERPKERREERKGEDYLGERKGQAYGNGCCGWAMNERKKGGREKCWVREGRRIKLSLNLILIVMSI